MKKIQFMVAVWIAGGYLSAAAPAVTLHSLGETVKVGTVEGIDIEVRVQSPSAQDTPLQVVGVFEYTEGDIYNSPPALPKELNGMVHIDVALKGLITDIRRNKRFEGKLLETLLIIPPTDSISAKKLLLVGLGKRDDFNADIMRLVGVVGMREALRLGVDSYSHASDIKDAGIDSPTGKVTGNVIKGAIEAFRTQSYLKEKQASEPLTVKKITLLSGPAYFEDSQKGIKDIIE